MRRLTRSTAYCFVWLFMLVICACTIVVLTVAGAVVGLTVSVMVGCSNDPVNSLVATVLAGAGLGWSINFVADTIGPEMVNTRAAIREVWR